jgi:hypothetical protein
MNTETLKAQDQTFFTMKIRNQNGKEEIANLQYTAFHNVLHDYKHL